MSLTFSVVVTAYDNAQYLPGCLDSLAAQTHDAWECVVVDDASPDATAEVARSYAGRDARFRVLSLEKNGGLHLARKAGLAACTGDYVIFLDADDELAPDALEGLARALGDERPDMVHFGIEVVGCGVPAEDCAAFEANVNAPQGPLAGEALLSAVFDEDGGYVQDWRVTQRAYRTAPAREAFDAMTDERLERAEDCYELLVLADHAAGEVTVNDVRALRYFYGRGVTGTSAISPETFARFCAQFGACVDALERYADAGAPTLRAHVDGARAKLLDLLMNDWHRRLADADKPAGARAAAERFGDGAIAAQLMRLVRDDAYADLKGQAPYDGTAPYRGWFDLADELADAAGQDGLPASFARLRASAYSHLHDLEYRESPVEVADATRPVRAHDYDRQRVRVFVTTHKDVALFDSDVLQPVQVGAARPRKRLLWAYQDDDGDNIAELNTMYCELTTQWWAWKNVDADYYGFCHYRRYFDFSDEPHEENPYGEIMDGYVDGDTQRRYRLDDASIEEAVRGWDVVTTGVNDVSEFPEHYVDLRDHYARAPYLNIADLERMVEILGELHPDYAEDAETFLSGHTACFCNMFVMRKELFDRYCAWMFPVLERFCEGWDATHLGQQALRTPGHLSERLLNIFLIHEARVNPELRHKQLQCVHFEHPERPERLELDPVEPVGGRPVVPVVLAADDNYVPMLTTTIASMLANASCERTYDVVVFQHDITKRHQDEVARFVAERHDNARVRFFDVERLVHAYHLRTNNEHISVETYYRFLIQDVLPGYDKVLYLDSDLVVLGDVAKLYDTELGDDLLGAVRDVDYLGNLNMPDGLRLAYSRDVLGLADPYDYFQAGVLLLNVREMRGLHTAGEWLALAADSRYIYDDQDILNAECQGRVTYLDQAWNVMHDCGGRIENVFSYAPADVFAAYRAAYAHPLVIHYAGFEKPWKPGACDLREVYWRYARETPFYEDLLGSFTVTPMPPYLGPAPHERAVGENSPVRRVFDPLLPLGSRRREAAKAIVRALRGRR